MSQNGTSAAPSASPVFTVPPAYNHLAELFSAIGSLGAFLNQARFVAPWCAWTRPSPHEHEVMLNEGADQIAIEIRALELAKDQLEMAIETQHTWLRMHRPDHPILKEFPTNGWNA
jgi:hypothetical protein